MTDAATVTAADRDWASSDYSRLYHTVIDDAKFTTIYCDDAAWAAYTRLLMVADMTFPARPPLPASVKRAALKKLVDAGVVVVSAGHYTIVALSKERAARFGGGKGRPRYPSDDRAKSEPAPESVRSVGATEPEASRSEPEPHVRARPSGSVYDSVSTEGGAGGNDDFERVLHQMSRWRLGVDSGRPMVARDLSALVRGFQADGVIRAMQQALDDSQRSGQPIVDGLQLIARAKQILAPLYAVPVKPPTAEQRARDEGDAAYEEAKRSVRKVPA